MPNALLIASDTCSMNERRCRRDAKRCCSRANSAVMAFRRICCSVRVGSRAVARARRMYNCCARYDASESMSVAGLSIAESSDAERRKRRAAGGLLGDFATFAVGRVALVPGAAAAAPLDAASSRCCRSHARSPAVVRSCTRCECFCRAAANRDCRE